MSENHLDPVPDGQRFFASIIVPSAARALEFYARAFGAREDYRLDMPDGRIGHAEFTFEGVRVMLADEFPELGFLAPQGVCPVSLTVYVPDVDALAARASNAGATLERPITDEFYGDRVATLRDPFGYRWSFHARRELVSPEEMRARMNAGS